MTTSGSSPARVVAVIEPGAVQEQITTALSAQPEFQLVDILSNMERLTRDLRAHEPEIILIGDQIGGQPTLDIIDDLAIQFPDTAIVAIVPGEQPLAAQQVMLAGARAFIIQPFTQVNLLSTLRRVRDLEIRRNQSKVAIAPSLNEEKRPLRTLAIYSPRGGVGCTTVAINLATALVEETAERVLLMEGKLFFGHLDVMLNIRNRNTIADLIPHASTMDAALINDVVVQHASGMHVLLGPSDVQVAQGIRPQDLFSIVEGLQRLYDYIVIDTGSTLNENSVTLMDASDRLLLVTSPDLAALHDTSRFIQVSRTLAFPPNKLMVLLNRSELPGGVRTRDIEAALHHEVFETLPDDGPNALRSLNRGIPLMLKYPRSPTSKAFQRLAKKLVGLAVEDKAVVATAKKNGKVKGQALKGIAQSVPANKTAG